MNTLTISVTMPRNSMILESGTSTVSSTTWLPKHLNQVEVLYGVARTMMGMYNLILLPKVGCSYSNLCMHIHIYIYKTSLSPYTGVNHWIVVMLQHQLLSPSTLSLLILLFSLNAKPGVDVVRSNSVGHTLLFVFFCWCKPCIYTRLSIKSGIPPQKPSQIGLEPGACLQVASMENGH